MKRGNSSPLGYFSAIIGHLSEGCEGRKRCKLVRLGTTQESRQRLRAVVRIYILFISHVTSHATLLESDPPNYPR